MLYCPGKGQELLSALGVNLECHASSIFLVLKPPLSIIDALSKSIAWLDKTTRQLDSAKQRYEKQVFIVQVIEIAGVWWNSIATTFKAEQSIWATCMLKLPNVAQHNFLFLNKGNVFNWPWTAHSNIYASRSYLKTICQRQNHLRK